MSEEQPARPLANLLGAMTEGAAILEMSAEDFVYIDRDCEYFKARIRQIQVIAMQIANNRGWGLGDENDRLVSAGAVVERFRSKAVGADGMNSVYEVMEHHYRIVEDFQEVHRIARERMMQADSEFAAKLTHLNETLADRGPVERSPEEALAALARMPVVGTLFAGASQPAAPSLWPGVPTDGAGQ